MSCITPIVTATVQVETRAESNDHSHWSGRAKRSSAANAVVFDALAQLAERPSVARGLVVRMTRITPNGLDDDNGVNALKHVRDAVARWLRINDRDARVTWLCQQSLEPGPMRAQIEVFPRGLPAPGVIVADEQTVYAVRAIWEAARANLSEREVNEFRSALARAGIPECG